MFHNVTAPAAASAFPDWPDALYAPSLGALSGRRRRRRRKGIFRRIKRLARKLAPVALLTPGVAPALVAKRLLMRKKRRRRRPEEAAPPEVLAPEVFAPEEFAPAGPVILPTPAAALPPPTMAPPMIPGAAAYGPPPVAPPMPPSAPEAEIEFAPVFAPPSYLPTWEEEPGPPLVITEEEEEEGGRFVEPVRGELVEPEPWSAAQWPVWEGGELGQVFWWQPTPPTTLGQRDFVERYIVRPATKVVRALAPVAGVTVVPRAAVPAAYPAYPVPEATAIPGWAWALLAGGAGLGALWILMPARPRRRTQRRRRR